MVLTDLGKGNSDTVKVDGRICKQRRRGGNKNTSCEDRISFSLRLKSQALVHILP